MRDLVSVRGRRPQGAGCPGLFAIQPVPPILSSLLHRTRISILVLLILVLPLQSVWQLVAGVQGHRHMHTGAAASTSSRHDSALSSLTRPLRLLLDQLHAAQDPRLQSPGLSWALSSGPAAGLHEHGGVFHRHSHDTRDVVDVGDPADDSVQGGATAFLAWVPCALALGASPAGGCPVTAAFDWRNRVIAPSLTPPRG